MFSIHAKRTKLLIHNILKSAHRRCQDFRCGVHSEVWYRYEVCRIENGGSGDKLTPSPQKILSYFVSNWYILEDSFMYNAYNAGCSDVKPTD